MRSSNLGVVVVSMAALLASCAALSGTNQPEAPPDLGWLFDSITFEIAPITSAEPSPRALDTFRNRLHENHLCRRENVSFIMRRTVAGPPPGMPWSSGLLTGYESLRRSAHDDDPLDRDLKVFVAYIDGPWLEGGTLRFLGGLQYGPSAFAIFKSGAGDREASVLLHEFGHVLGLVKVETSENHDPVHTHHCVIRSCVMYWCAPGPDSNFDLYCRRQIIAMIRARDVDDED